MAANQEGKSKRNNTKKHQSSRHSSASASPYSSTKSSPYSSREPSPTPSPRPKPKYQILSATNMVLLSLIISFVCLAAFVWIRGENSFPEKFFENKPETDKQIYVKGLFIFYLILVSIFSLSLFIVNIFPIHP